MQMLFRVTDAIPQKGDFMDPYGPITARSEKKVVVDGREWIDFTFKTARDDVTLRVDPATNLPMLLTYNHPQSPVRSRFEYPAEGPENIYAFGAPATATVVDCRPPVEVAKIRKELRTAANRLGDYVGHIVHLTAGRTTEVTRVCAQDAAFDASMLATRGTRKVFQRPEVAGRCDRRAKLAHGARSAT